MGHWWEARASWRRTSPRLLPPACGRRRGIEPARKRENFTMILASFGTVGLSFVFILISLLLIGLILLQKNRGSGLSGAFGGVGGHSAFGTKTGDFLTWLTVGLTGVFLLLAIVGNFAFAPTKPPKSVPVAPAPMQTP